MVASLYYFALSCFVLLAFGRVASGINCYQCDACGGHSNSWGSTSSPSNTAQCFKYFYKAGAVSYANRGLRDPCSPGSDGIGGTTYCCSTDNCNDAVSLSTSLALVLTLLAANSLFKTVTTN